MIEMTVDASKVIARFASMPDKLRKALLGKMHYFTSALLIKVQSNLDNKLLRFITGELYGSMFQQVDSDASGIVGTVYSSASSKAAPYARIQEFGGTTKAHVIEAVNAKALAFKDHYGEMAFFKKVNHPGSTIPAHHYLSGPFDDMKPTIPEGFNEAIAEAISE